MNNSKLLKLMIVGLMMITLAGCSSSDSTAYKGNNSETPSPDVVVPRDDGLPSGTGPTDSPVDTGGDGSTADFQMTSLTTMADYTGRSMNAPTNIKVNMNFTKLHNSYGGSVTISYTENGQQRSAEFSTGSAANEVKDNVWMFQQGAGNDIAFHAVLEDFYGAIVIVLDKFTDLGDGDGPEDTIGGTVYYRNFGYSESPRYWVHNGQKRAKCWLAGIGPYECRPWPKSGVSMDTYESVAPAARAGYTKLGSFSNMSLSDAFNGEELNVF